METASCQDEYCDAVFPSLSLMTSQEHRLPSEQLGFPHLRGGCNIGLQWLPHTGYKRGDVQRNTQSGQVQIQGDRAHDVASPLPTQHPWQKGGRGTRRLQCGACAVSILPLVLQVSGGDWEGTFPTPTCLSGPLSYCPCDWASFWHHAVHSLWWWVIVYQLSVLLDCNLHKVGIVSLLFTAVFPSP